MNQVETAFRPASRSEAKPLVGLYSESGCGKTWSALLLARGFVGTNGTIGMIETEGGRGEAYVGRAPVGDYLARPIRSDFSPIRYGEAITGAEAAKLDALIIDSASHEWEGAGGVLSMAADNQAKGTKGVLVWQQPKIHHQRNFMLRLMQTPIPLVIVCMRAKYPMQQIKGEWQRSTVLEPKQADDILFEMFVHGWIDAEHRLHVTKYTLPELADVIRDNEPITIESGQRLAAWAKGTPSPRHVPSSAEDQPATSRSSPDAVAGEVVLTELEKIGDESLAAAAARGKQALQEEFQGMHTGLQKALRSRLEAIHWPIAVEADHAKKGAVS